jgi:predicted Rossmann fold flavoprotein
MYDVIVVGGGAAGMMASVTAAGAGLHVLLLEKNSRCGRKLGITGKGRCNVTNHCTPKEVIDSVPTGGKFLFSALEGFSPQDTIAFFEGLGVPLKTERGNRVFPQSDRAADIVNALWSRMHSLGVTVRQADVARITTDGGVVSGVVTETGKAYEGKNIILATGGLSYPATGSTGAGYHMAAALGHTIVPPSGSLVPLTSEDACCARMQGLSLKNVRLTVSDGGKKPVFEDFGEMLFTHFGVSGPLVLSASAHMRQFDRKNYTLSIDLKPSLDEKKLDERILRDFEKYANRDFANSLSDLLPRKMIPVMVQRSGIFPETKTNAVTRQQRRHLVELIKDFRITVSGKRPVEEAIVTTGGVELKQINPKTMESKLVSGLFFAGEILNADAYTGGFNLQIAWSTAYAAATHLQNQNT